MIVVVEGIDKVGKTEFCKHLERLGFCYFKDAWNFECPSIEVHTFSSGKLDTTISALKLLSDKGRNVVVDRFHLTEIVYGTHSRGLLHYKFAQEVDRALAKLDSMLVYIKPSDIEWSCNAADEDLILHNEYFSKLYDQSVIETKIVAAYPNLDIAAAWIARKVAKHDFYFASPFFNPDQIEREEALKKLLRDQGFSVYSPKEACHLPPNATVEDRRKVFNENLDAIKNCMMVFAVTDGKDMGTIWEAGYAYGINKPIVYFAETLGEGKFNLMLAQSGERVFSDRDSISATTIFDTLLGAKNDFCGVIE